MEKHLPAIFEWLKALDADICHYKVCSTFDSSPAIGNIGKAIEIGKALYGQPVVPVVVGAAAAEALHGFRQSLRRLPGSLLPYRSPTSS